MIITKKMETNDSVLNIIDEYIGSRIRVRRNLLGLSQDQLAQMLNISFQQVQKYEKGNNRIAGSRIWQLARALNVSVGYFFEGIERNLIYKGIDFDGYAGDCLCDSFDDDNMPEVPYGMETNVKELVDAFIAIKNPVVATQILELVKTLGSSEQTNENTFNDEY